LFLVRVYIVEMVALQLCYYIGIVETSTVEILPGGLVCWVK
jgi:hypothetical protein